MPEAVDPGSELMSNAPDRSVLEQALDELPDQQRRALESAYFKGMSASEIAEQEDIPIGTVKSRLAAALRKLREVVRDEMWDDE